MTLFVTSTFADSVGEFVKEVPTGRVLFIANPSDPFRYRYWVKKDYRAFVKAGFSVTKCDLRKINAAMLDEKIYEYDILHVCGGSAIYILKLLRENGFDEVILRAIRRGLVYTGTSAGSMILAPDISFCADDEDEKEAKMVGKLKDLRGLGLVSYYLMCHVQEKYYIPSTKKAMSRLPEYKFPILFLRDGVAVWHTDSGMRIVP